MHWKLLSEVQCCHTHSESYASHWCVLSSLADLGSGKHKRRLRFRPPKQPARNRRTKKRNSKIVVSCSYYCVTENENCIQKCSYRNQHALWFLQWTAASQECDDNDECGNANNHQQTDVIIVLCFIERQQKWCWIG